MGKFTKEERLVVKGIVSALSLKRIPDAEIIKEIYEQTHKMVSRQTISTVRRRIKADSYKWYKALRDSEYEYIHEFKERIDEVLWLQAKHYRIIERTQEPSTQQTSLAELHRLNITLSNYFDVAPEIINDTKTISKTLEEAPRADTV